MSSRGMSEPTILKYIKGSSRRTRSIASAPFSAKSFATISRKVSVSLLREPLGRPSGLPETPATKGRPRCFDTVISALIDLIPSSLGELSELRVPAEGYFAFFAESSLMQQQTTQALAFHLF